MWDHVLHGVAETLIWTISEVQEGGVHRGLSGTTTSASSSATSTTATTSTAAQEQSSVTANLSAGTWVGLQALTAFCVIAAAVACALLARPHIQQNLTARQYAPI